MAEWQPVAGASTAVGAPAMAQRLSATNAPASGPCTSASRPRPGALEPSHTTRGLQRIIDIGSPTVFSRRTTTTASEAGPFDAPATAGGPPATLPSISPGSMPSAVPEAPVWSVMQLQRTVHRTASTPPLTAAASVQDATTEPPKTTEPTVSLLPPTAEPPSNASTGSMSAGSTPTHETATPTGTSPTDIDALVGRLYEPIVRKLKAELRLDRERAGTALDLTL
ncbi:hypothetical protein ACQP0C_31540 [Nocardia sp. CA-129566]|uniref:hypothetical protein n=1 Tax=Nocardia sp. CA-129566 TaxID=3239976 RepID=UPI003D98C682